MVTGCSPSTTAIIVIIVSVVAALSLPRCLDNKINERMRLSIRVYVHTSTCRDGARLKLKRNESVFVCRNTRRERAVIEVCTLRIDIHSFYHCLNNVASANRRPRVGREN